MKKLYAWWCEWYQMILLFVLLSFMGGIYVGVKFGLFMVGIFSVSILNTHYKFKHWEVFYYPYMFVLIFLFWPDFNQFKSFGIFAVWAILTWVIEYYEREGGPKTRHLAKTLKVGDVLEYCYLEGKLIIIYEITDDIAYYHKITSRFELMLVRNQEEMRKENHINIKDYAELKRWTLMSQYFTSDWKTISIKEEDGTEKCLCTERVWTQP